MANVQSKVAESLQKAHRSLMEDLRKLENASQTISTTELTSQLAATRAHITEHFRFEEQNGYMDVVRKREPRLERQIQELSGEHRQLAQSLDSLIEQARKTSSEGQALRESVWQWVKQVHQHEIRENDLVQDAFNQDLAAED